MTTASPAPPERLRCPRCGAQMTFTGRPEKTRMYDACRSYTCVEGCGTRIRIFDMPMFKPCDPKCKGKMIWDDKAYVCDKCGGVEMPAGPRA